MKTKDFGRCAVMTAALIVIQYALSFVSGVELVTAVFAVFCYTFGAKQGTVSGISFSLLRCLIYGFMPNVVILYIIYYTLFAIVFGRLSCFKLPSVVGAILAALGAVLCLAALFVPIPVSALYAVEVKILLCAVSLIFAVISLLYIKENNETEGERLKVTAAAVFMTVLFTLLDDILTPFMFGYSSKAATVYFCGSIMVMLPQTICAAVSVFSLFKPLRKIFMESS